MLTEEQILDNKSKFISLLVNLNIDLTALTKYLISERVDYFNKPYNNYQTYSYRGSLCDHTIKLFEDYGIENFIVTNSFRRNPNDQRILFEYLIENKIDLVIDMKLNPIINANNKKLKEKYNIDMDELKKGRSK